jgi:hypothetical protein
LVDEYGARPFVNWAWNSSCSIELGGVMEKMATTKF